MSTTQSITVTDRYHNSLTLTSDGSDLKVETSSAPDAPIELDEVDRQKLRDFLIMSGS